MKNKTVKMVIAVAVLVVCCGAYAGVKTYVAKQEQKESEEETEEKTTVFSASADDIQSLDFMIDKNETTFEKDNDQWIKKDEKEFPVNQTTLDDAASSVTFIESDRVLSDVEDLEEYGLDTPSNTLKIVTKDSGDDSSEDSADDSAKTVTTTLYVGDENSSTSQYYVYKDDDKTTVYMVDASSIEPFTKDLYDYAQGEDFPAISNTDDINKIYVSGENSYELVKNDDNSLWTIQGAGDEKEKTDSATVSSLVSSFGSMAYNSFVNYKCDDKSEYGLDDPYAVITVDYQEEVENDSEDSDDTDNTEDTSSSTEENSTDTSESDDTDTADGDTTETTDSDTSDADSTDDTEDEKTMVDKQLVITVGKEADDSNRYIMVNDSDQVYTMSVDTLSAFTDKAEEDFLDMTVSYVSINNLSEMKVTYQGNEYKVNVSRETSTDDDGNEKETVTYKLNGKELESSDLTPFYNKLANMTAQKRLTEEYTPENDPEMTVTLKEEDGDSLEVSYYSYDTNYYAAVVGEKVYLVNKMNVKEMFTTFETMTGNETETDNAEDASEASKDSSTDDTEDSDSTADSTETQTTDSEEN